VKVNFLRTMNATVADPAGCSHRSPVQFFSCLNLILNAYLLYVYASANKQKQLCEFHLVMFHMQSTYLHKLTVRLRIQFVCFPFERSLRPDP